VYLAWRFISTSRAVSPLYEENFRAWESSNNKSDRHKTGLYGMSIIHCYNSKQKRCQWRSLQYLNWLLFRFIFCLKLMLMFEKHAILKLFVALLTLLFHLVFCNMSYWYRKEATDLLFNTSQSRRQQTNIR